MDYDPSDEKKAIDDAKAGVKGLVDSGIVEIPRIFIRPPHELAEELNICKSTLQVPVVDLSGIHVEDGRKKIVDGIREACEKWGLFQLINHGIPSSGKHTDPVFLTILLQDHNGGLQVMRNNQWADVTPIEHGLVVNIGDLLQILSNDKFVSANHRVVANKIGPRISVACFFNGLLAPSKMYGPIKELISKENPPLYKDFQVVDYVTKFFSKPLDKTGLDLFRL